MTPPDLTPAEFRKIRNSLGLSTRRMGLMLGLKPKEPGRTVRRWEAGDRDIPGPAMVLMRWLATGEKPELPPRITRRSGQPAN